MAQQIDAMIREMGNLAKKVEQLERTTPRPSRTAPGCFRCGSLDHRMMKIPSSRLNTVRRYVCSFNVDENVINQLSKIDTVICELG
ncbi:hypothetical protein T02_15676 [Trichinella nativa]|uniref:Uncharacterized protein n=1 Tax=Trichinella nativa TaxID=6335 RepID=A0A0V1L943_9BILA|nr:hypothetical protein T02_15676 [Trichinella nativa]